MSANHTPNCQITPAADRVIFDLSVDGVTVSVTIHRESKVAYVSSQHEVAVADYSSLKYRDGDYWLYAVV